jgi:radical SAM superfamily enzyme YgiQ (UPF0313 family)
MNIALIRVGKKGYDYSNESLGMGYLTSALRKRDINVDILDGEVMGNKEIEKAIVNKNYPLLGFSVDESNIIDSIELSRKFNKKFIVYGGVHATFTAYDLCKDNICNAVVLGEGDKTFHELVEASFMNSDLSRIKGICYKEKDKIRFTGPRDACSNFDYFPARDILSKFITKDKIKIARILTSRGCFFDCNFCTTPSMRKINPGQLYRERDIESILLEMENLAEQFRIEMFYINDDLYFHKDKKSRSKAYILAEEILKRRLKIDYKVEIRTDSIHENDLEFLIFLRKSGLSRMFLGLESGSNKFLDYLGKRTNKSINESAIKTLEKAGIKTTVGKILFNPTTNWEELKESVDFFYNIKSSYQLLRRPNSSLRAFPGTKITERLKKNKFIKEIRSYLPYKYIFQNKFVENFSRLLENSFNAYFPYLKPSLEKLIFNDNFEDKRKEINEICYLFLIKNINKKDNWNEDHFQKELEEFINNIK